MNTWSWLALEPLGAEGPQWQPIVAFPAQSPSSLGLAQRGTPFHETLAKLNQLRLVGPVVIVARTRGQLDRLLALFAEQDLPATTWKPHEWKSTAQKSPFALTQGELSAGFVSTEGRLAIVTEEELFAKGSHRHPQKSKAATFLSSLEDLKVGDYVVHMQYGIARYRDCAASRCRISTATIWCSNLPEATNCMSPSIG